MHCYLRSIRIAAPVLAGLVVVMHAGQVGNFRKFPTAPMDGSELTKNVTPVVPLVLGTRG